jgi:hypothetical protein
MVFGEEEEEEKMWKKYDSDGRGNKSRVLKRNKNTL